MNGEKFYCFFPFHFGIYFSCKMESDLVVYQRLILFIQFCCVTRCKCNQCRTDLLENAREYRCCWEVGPAMAKLTLDGSTEPSCVTQHQDYKDLTKRVVLEQVGPVLRDKQGRPYRRRAGQHINM